MAKDSKSKAATQTAEDAFIATAGTATTTGDDLLDTKATHAAKNDVPTGKALLQIKRHPLSEKYGPPTSEEEVDGMARDIKENGQHETIKLYEGMVLAGWTRYQACLRIGKEPRVENYLEDKPEAVAFGTNVIRRRLSSISKAYMGAQFYLSMQDSATPPRQQDLAKQCTVSLNRLSQCIQLLRLDTDEGKAAQKTLRQNPEVTNTQFDEMLLECGIARTASKPPAESASRMGPEEDDLDDLDDLDESDLTGGAIDRLLDGEDDLEEEDSDSPRPPKQRKEIGEGAAPIPAVGASRGTEATRPQETMVSKLSKHFNNLSPSEQVQFVSFAWKKLGPAVSQAITDGKVKFEMPTDVPEGKAKGSAYKKQVDAAKPPKAEAKPASPAQLAAREKFAAASKAKAAEKAAQAPAEAPAKPATPKGEATKAARGKAATAPAKPVPAKGAAKAK